MQKISEVIKQRRLRLADQCIRHNDNYHITNFYGSQSTAYETEIPNTFIAILKNDRDCEEDELRILMMDREGWKAIARSG